MVNNSLLLTHAFPVDGIYECTVSITTPIDYYQEIFYFTVQYAILDITFGLANSHQGYNPIITDYESLLYPEYYRTLEFLILRPSDAPLPTNASWEIDFGNGLSLSSEKFIAAADESLSVTSYRHTLSLFYNCTEGGDLSLIHI